MPQSPLPVISDGWGHTPLHMVQADLAKGTLVKIRFEGFAREMVMSMKAVFRKDAPAGPAGRAFIEQPGKGASISPRERS